MKNLTIEEFGKQLLETGDLDPVYVMLYNSNLTYEQKCAWCVSYWCYYHSGVAFHMSDWTDRRTFWKWMLAAAKNESKSWPRGTERRHFRGKMAISSVAELAKEFREPTDVVDHILSFGSRFEDISSAARSLRGFGPWIAFKVADMLDRVLGHTVDFEGCQLAFYRQPLEGARLACEKWGIQNQDPVRYSVDRLREDFKDFKAPPFEDRPVGIPEIETILCKWKSHMNGHYPVGKDTKEIRHGLTGWGDTAERAKLWLPEGVKV